MYGQGRPRHGHALIDPSGRDVGVPSHTVDQPGVPAPTTAAPGQAAWAGIKWTSCDTSDEACGVGNALRIGPPGGQGTTAELSEFPAPERVAITMSDVQIGSLQPARQGVVAW